MWCYPSVQFSSVAQLCPTLCNPMDWSTPGLLIHHQLLEFTQIHVRWISDAIQPSHSLSSPSPPALNLSQHQGLFQWVSSSNHVAKVLEFQIQHQSFQWTPRTDLQDGLVGSLYSPRDYQESSPTPQFKSINSSVLSFLYSPTLISIHGYWKNRSFIYLFIFSFIFISWRLITLQYCSGFCHTLIWISHGFTCIPHPDPPSHLPLCPIPLGLPSAPGLSTCLMHPTWASDLFHPR